jgi:hypothetical protein
LGPPGEGTLGSLWGIHPPYPLLRVLLFTGDVRHANVLYKDIAWNGGGMGEHLGSLKWNGRGMGKPLGFPRIIYPIFIGNIINHNTTTIQHEKYMRHLLYNRL